MYKLKLIENQEENLENANKRYFIYKQAEKEDPFTQDKVTIWEMIASASLNEVKSTLEQNIAMQETLLNNYNNEKARLETEKVTHENVEAAFNTELGLTENN